MIKKSPSQNRSIKFIRNQDHLELGSFTIPKKSKFFQIPKKSDFTQDNSRKIFVK